MIKQDINLYLIVILVVLLYCKPYFLDIIVQNPLGKLLMLVAVIYISHNHGITPGIMSGLIFILVMHNILEGVDETLEKQSKEDDSDIDVDETDNSEEEDQNENEDELTAQDTKKQTDLLDMQDSIKSDVSGIETTQNEPVGSSVSKDTKEGFSLIK
jgi:uncharacterized membrane protein YhiD involved in acid resistance